MLVDAMGIDEGKSEYQAFQALGKKHVTDRNNYPHEIAEMVYYLASKNRSGNITGSNFVIDGGATIKLSIS